MKENFDTIFKAALLGLMALFLWLYAQGRDVGRFAYFRDGELEFVLDTTTGVVYQGGYAMNHLTGKEGSAADPPKGPVGK